VLAELEQSLSAVTQEMAEALCTELLAARKVFVIGVGRVMLMMQAFAKRLNHLGIETYFVGEINEPAITERDLLVIGSGSGETAIPVAISQVAKRFDPQIVHIGSNMESTISRASDIHVRIPCRTKLNRPDEIHSFQPMSTLFEQALLLFLDCICVMLIEEKRIDVPSLWQLHANLE